MQKAVGTLIVIMRALALNHTIDVVWCGVVWCGVVWCAWTCVGPGI
jgi:hypothetical protein